ncbi:MAG: hypothetical protein JWO62_1489 [Acidimicrobiaceae bacterium]|nr:hypothetical protein [Acidimicrobiaceae bacterium]
MSWDGTAANTAISGLRALVGRPDWRDAPERERARIALIQQLESTQPQSRMLASNAIVHLYDGAELEAQLSTRLASEVEPQVQEGLLGALCDLAQLDPVSADRVLETLADTESFAAVHYRPDEEIDDLTRADGRLTRTLLETFVRLAIWSGTQYAARAWADWSAHPIEATATVRSLVQFNRKAMISRTPEPDDSQRRAFTFVAELSERVLSIIDDSETQDTAATRIRARAVQVAHAIAVEFYFASGALPPNNTPPEEEVLRRPERSFVTLALPILKRLATTGDVPTAHQVIQTLAYLSRIEPRPALMAITTAALAAPGYEREEQGEETMFHLFDQILANDTDGIFDDDECLDRIREVLERYIDLASTPAISQMQRLSQSFR